MGDGRVRAALFEGWELWGDDATGEFRIVAQPSLEEFAVDTSSDFAGIPERMDGNGVVKCCVDDFATSQKVSAAYAAGDYKGHENLSPAQRLGKIVVAVIRKSDTGRGAYGAS